MSELITPTPDHDIERAHLQQRLAAIDHDPTKLQEFLNEIYGTATENPQIFYAAATQLTSALFLEHRTPEDRISLPSPEDAGRAFASYTQLLAMLHTEKTAPLYANDVRIQRRLAGSREELAFHAALVYAAAKGGDFVAMPTPADIDFMGGEDATDVQIFFAGAKDPDLEIQVKLGSSNNDYHPRIAILSLETALGSREKAGRLRGTLLQAGKVAQSQADLQLPPQEHAIILDGAAAIMKATYEWGTEHTTEVAIAA